MRGVDSLCVAQRRDKWLDVVNMVTNHHIPLHAGIFLTIWWDCSFKYGLYSWCHDSCL